MKCYEAWIYNSATLGVSMRHGSINYIVLMLYALVPDLIWLVFFFLCFHTLGIIIPSDELIFFRGVENTNQYMSFTIVTWANITMLPKSQLGKT